MDNRQWGVWCRVSGGVTGHRQAWLKNEAGGFATFKTRAEAEESASILQAARAGMTAPAYSYVAKPMGESREG